MIEMTMRDYVRVLFRQKWVLGISFVAIVITVAIWLVLMTPVYEANVKILVSSDKLIASQHYRGLMGYQNTPIVVTQSEIVMSNPVMERAVKVLGLYAKPLDYEKSFASLPRKALIKIQMAFVSKEVEMFKLEQKQAYLYRLALEDLKEHIKVEPIRNTNIFTISVKDYSPISATIIANVISRSYVIFDLEQQLADMQVRYDEKNPAVIQLKDSIDKMIKGLNGEPLPDVEAMGLASVKIIEQASVPIRPFGKPKIVVFILALFKAVFLSVMFAFIFDYLNQTFKSPKDIEAYLGITCLGSIRKKADDDEYHAISDEIFLELKDKGLKSVMVTSAEGREGTTTIVAGVGKYLSGGAGHKTLLIDANLRHPRLHETFNVKNTIGLGNILGEKTTFDSAVKDINPKLSIITAGSTDLKPVVLFDSHKMGELLKEAKSKYETIIIDAPCLGRHKDSELIAAVSDSVCLVVSENGARRQVAKIALEPIMEKKSYILGAVLNKRTFAIPKWLYDRV
ncbi:MAG: polysaccharide biosynthesis tyrosine autokinase [Candidatus Omnitrophica bacterium]|nr:polysaccharide biosynthesis tyrosine autokinase [Candidatus Omnitrophota bacterium]